MNISIEIRPEIKAVWVEQAAAESRKFRAYVTGKPRPHSAPPTIVEELRAGITPEPANPRAVIMHQH